MESVDADQEWSDDAVFGRASSFAEQWDKMLAVWFLCVYKIFIKYAWATEDDPSPETRPLQEGWIGTQRCTVYGSIYGWYNYNLLRMMQNDDESLISGKYASVILLKIQDSSPQTRQPLSSFYFILKTEMNWVKLKPLLYYFGLR